MKKYVKQSSNSLILTDKWLLSIFVQTQSFQNLINLNYLKRTFEYDIYPPLHNPNAYANFVFASILTNFNNFCLIPTATFRLIQQLTCPSIYNQAIPFLFWNLLKKYIQKYILIANQLYQCKYAILIAYNKLLVGSLITIPLTRNLTQSFFSVPKFQYSLYFLRGNDQRDLNLSHEKEILNLVQNSDLKTSTFVYNSFQAKRKYRAWTKALPWIKPHYAIKANPSIPLLQDLIEQGSNFDCASRNQLQTLLNMGVKASDLVYSNPIKDDDDLIWAAQNKIELTTADSIDQLKKIKEYAPKMKVLWRIAIKEDASDNLSTSFSGKFGDDLDSPQKIEQRMREIRQMGINISGIHFHCGSGHHGSSGFERAIVMARQCMQIGRQNGHEMSILDIGGGFPSGDLTQKTLNALKTTERDPLNYKIIAQPGRHFSGNAFYLLTKVLGKRMKNGKNCYHLNESLYHSFNCNLMDGVSFQNSSSQFYSKIESQTSEPSGIYETNNSTLFGMTCDGMDIITKNINTPVDMKVGDWLCISGMGAYTYGCRSSFNGMKSTEKIIRWNAKLLEDYAEQEMQAEPARIF